MDKNEFIYFKQMLKSIWLQIRIKNILLNININNDKNMLIKYGYGKEYEHALGKYGYD